VLYSVKLQQHAGSWDVHQVRNNDKQKSGALSGRRSHYVQSAEVAQTGWLASCKRYNLSAQHCKAFVVADTLLLKKLIAMHLSTSLVLQSQSALYRVFAVHHTAVVVVVVVAGPNPSLAGHNAPQQLVTPGQCTCCSSKVALPGVTGSCIWA
jgi:hypothetical protein